MHGSRTFGIRVWPGKEGLRKFCDDVRAVCSLKAADHISLTFSCKAPRTGADDAVLLMLCCCYDTMLP